MNFTGIVLRVNKCSVFNYSWIHAYKLQALREFILKPCLNPRRFIEYIFTKKKSSQLDLTHCNNDDICFLFTCQTFIAKVTFTFIITLKFLFHPLYKGHNIVLPYFHSYLHDTLPKSNYYIDLMGLYDSPLLCFLPRRRSFYCFPLRKLRPLHSPGT